VNAVIGIPGIPKELDWVVEPAVWRFNDGVLAVEAGPRTDLFVDPADGTRYDNAPRLLTTVDGDFQLGARVRVTFAAQYDAGVLLLWESHERWAKLCFERSPQGRPTIVTVVNRGVSDDANGWPVDADTVWLRVSRIGRSYALHASTDGAWWDLTRYFALDGTGPVQVGFLAQAPHGSGCGVRFDEVRFVATAPGGLRDGS
jgi:regulation of enolase protein 1 (concanavalin A-like superfamily)